jgi:hypothetical protein
MGFGSRFAFVLALAYAPALYADIGEVGSPVVPTNLPELPAAAPAATPAPKPDQPHHQANGAALMVIRFYQSKVYFERALKEAITASERADNTAQYEVVSTIPMTVHDMDSNHIERNADQNMQSVIYYMENLGVPQSRIHSSTAHANEIGKEQTVTIYVK